MVLATKDQVYTPEKVWLTCPDVFSGTLTSGGPREVEEWGCSHVSLTVFPTFQYYIPFPTRIKLTDPFSYFLPFCYVFFFPFLKVFPHIC